VRSFLIMIAGALGVTQAAAADLPAVLRGPIVGEVVQAYRWDGIYGGGQIGVSVANVDFTNAARTLVAEEVRLLTIEQDQQISQWAVLPKKNPVGGSFGAFVGYNCQWDDAVVGVELNYNRASLSASSDSAIERSFFDSTNVPAGHHYFYDVTVIGSASAHITDWATLRLRGAWAAGPFLPYGFVGFAVGRSDVSRSGTVLGSATDVPDVATPPLTPLPDLAIFETAVDARKGVFAYGGAAGLGVDVAVWRNVFLRGEWEYVKFAPFQGIRLQINTVRTGLGLKF
jgi:outer membrane immunogenic protein